jgi:hypothetical protein
MILLSLLLCIFVSNKAVGSSGYVRSARRVDKTIDWFDVDNIREPVRIWLQASVDRSLSGRHSIYTRSREPQVKCKD